MKRTSVSGTIHINSYNLQPCQAQILKNCREAELEKRLNPLEILMNLTGGTVAGMNDIENHGFPEATQYLQQRQSGEQALHNIRLPI